MSHCRRLGLDRVGLPQSTPGRAKSSITGLTLAVTAKPTRRCRVPADETLLRDNPGEDRLPDLRAEDAALHDDLAAIGRTQARDQS